MAGLVALVLLGAAAPRAHAGAAPAVPQAVAEGPERAAALRAEGERHLTRGDTAAALNAFRAAVALDPADALSHDRIGVILGDHGAVDEAMASFLAATSADPLLASAQFHLGLAFDRIGRTNEATAALHHALWLEPDLPEARFALSLICARLGDLDGSIVQLRAVVGQLPDLYDGWYNLGLNLWNRYRRDATRRDRTDLDAAIEALGVAVRLGPDVADAHLALGQVLAEAQEFGPALESLRRALRLASEKAAYAYNLGLAQRLAGDLDGARSTLEQSVRADERNALVWRALGLVRRQHGDLSGARAALESAVSLAPDDPQAHHLLGAVLLKSGEQTGGIRHLREAIRLDPELTEARVLLARALAGIGQRSAAEDQQAEVRRINSRRAAGARALVLMQAAADREKNGDRASAGRMLRDAIDQSPLTADAHLRLARLLAADPTVAAECERALGRALELEPDRASAHLLAGTLRHRRGDARGAEAAFRRASSLAPGLIEAHGALLEIGMRRRDWTTVIRASTAVLAAVPDDAHAELALGQAFVETRQWPQAVLALRRVTESEDGARSATAHHLLARALEGSGASEEAAAALARARELGLAPSLQ